MLADLLLTREIAHSWRGVEWLPLFLLVGLDGNIMFVRSELVGRDGCRWMLLVLDGRVGMLSSGSLDAHCHDLDLSHRILLDGCPRALLLAHEMNMSLGISSDQLSCMGTRQTGHSNLVCIHWNMHR